MKQKGFSPILAILLIVVIGAVGFGAYYFGTQQNNAPKATSEISDQNGAIPTMNPAETIAPVVGKAEANTLYLATYQNKDVLFHAQDANLQKGYTSNLGEQGGNEVTFNQLQNPKKIWSTTDYALAGITGGLLDNANKALFVGVLLGDKNTTYHVKPVNKIIRTDLTNGNSTEIWSHAVNNENTKYNTGRGAGYTEKVSTDGKFLVLNIAACYACDGGIVGQVILNTSTKAEKYIEQIGNVQFDLKEGGFTYQKLQPFKETCEDGGGYGCDENNERTTYKPAGETLTEKLP